MSKVLKELKHLLRLLEPLEADGSLDVPGLATLNGARRAVAEAEALEPGYFRDSDGAVKQLPACSTCGRQDVRECWARGHQPQTLGQSSLGAPTMRTADKRIAELEAECRDLRDLAQRPLVNQVDLGDVVRLVLKTAAAMAESRAKSEAEVMASRRLQLLGLDVQKAVLREMAPSTRA